jgi:hypothetical protein
VLFFVQRGCFLSRLFQRHGIHSVRFMRLKQSMYDRTAVQERGVVLMVIVYISPFDAY